MQFVWRRYSRSGYAPPLFYVVIALGFVALAVYGAVQGDWLVMALAVVMVPVTYAGSRVMRRLGEAETASRRQIAAEAAKKDEST
jgi:hypothetical protein